MAKQLNIFIENRPGRLLSVTRILKENGINMRAMTILDRRDFGILKIIVDKPQEAHIALSQQGFAVALKDIVPVVIDDSAGSFSDFLEKIAPYNINISNAYGFVIAKDKKAVMCIETETPDALKQALEKENIEMLADEAIYTV